MPVRTPADANCGARHELRLEPRLVEPRRLDLPRLVRDACGEDLQPTTPTARRGADDAFDDGLLVAEEIADPLRRNGLLVPARTLPQQIPDRREAELPEPTRDRRADPLERLDRGVEQLRPRRRPRPRPVHGRRHASEADRQRGTCERPHQPAITIGPDCFAFWERCDAAATADAFRDRRDRDPRSWIPICGTSRQWPTCTASPAASGTTPRRARRAGLPSSRWSSAHFVAECPITTIRLSGYRGGRSWRKLRARATTSV